MYNLNADKEKYYYLGKVIKTHGYRGELVFLLETDQPGSYAGLKVVFINMEQSLVPWFIEDIQIKEDLAVVKLEDISEPELARSFVKKELYLPLDDLQKLDGNDFYFHELVGFNVTDEEYGEIGKVEEILERPEQDLIRIMNGKKEILVPLTDEIILDIDRKNKILHLDTPPGLIDLYLD
jgi:16S rRNA processing protein RimM